MLPTLFLLMCLPQLGAEGTPQPSALALPKAHFLAQPGDPPWLVQVAQFHGHLGPSVVVGTRFGLAGLRAVGARGFFDVEVSCEGPLLALLGSLKGAAKTAAAPQEDHEHGVRAQSPVESLARKIAAMSDAELVVVRVTTGP